MNIVEIIQHDLPEFTGICFRERDASPEKVRELKVSMAWLLNKSRAQWYIGKKVLVAGYGVHKGKYFTATIVDIKSVREMVISGKWEDALAYQNSLYDNWIQWHQNRDVLNNPVDKRFGVIFENPTEIKRFSEHFSFSRGNFYYIHAKTQNISPILPPLPKDDAPLYRLKELFINGFKDKNRNIKITFYDGAITVIHGENGSGKTTFLRVIQAILKKDITYLKQQNVQGFDLTFWQGQTEEGERIMSCPDIEQLTYDKDTLEIYEILEKFSRSVFFGVHRGLQDNLGDIRKKLLNMRNLGAGIQGSAVGTLDQILSSIAEKEDISWDENHISVEKLGVEVIEETLCRAFDKGEKAILRGMNNAFFDTMDSFLSMDYEKDVVIPPDFEADFKAKKIFFLSFLKELKDSASKEKLKQFIEADDLSLIHKEKPLFKTLVINLLNQTKSEEQENIELRAISTLINTFNAFISQEKTIEKTLHVDSYRAKILLPNHESHSLKDLSSGELHLLSFLTLFLVLRRTDNVFFIDEPEISLSMAWQRKLLPLLSEFAPQAQIIVATHSPSIVYKNTNYLVELPNI